MRIYTKILIKSTKKAHNRIWTGDLFLTKEVLYRLSYMGNLSVQAMILKRGLLYNNIGVDLSATERINKGQD